MDKCFGCQQKRNNHEEVFLKQRISIINCLLFSLHLFYRHRPMCQRGLFQLSSLNKFSHLYEAPRLDLLMDDGAGSRHENVERPFLPKTGFQMDNILSFPPFKIITVTPLKVWSTLSTAERTMMIAYRPKIFLQIF